MDPSICLLQIQFSLMEATQHDHQNWKSENLKSLKKSDDNCDQLTVNVYQVSIM